MHGLLARGRPSPTFIVSLLALFLALGGVGYAATGGRLILGRANSASKGTLLRSAAGPTLTLSNTRGGLAAKFNVLSSKPPFAVNSRATVTNLSADLLDGLDSSAFQRLVTGACTPAEAIQAISPNGIVQCADALSGTWNRTGNGGTDPTNDFLGTTDGNPLLIKANGTEAIRVQPSGDVGIGDSAPTARLEVQTSGQENAISAVSQSGVGVNGNSTSGDGLTGVSISANGVGGQSTSANGVHGVSNSGNGVLGNSSTATGVLGQSTSGTGVGGASTSGDGVRGTSNSNDGVAGVSTSLDGILGITNHPSGGSTAAAVRAINNGGGDIFLGQSQNIHVARIDSAGTGFFDGGTQNSGADYAEAMKTSVDSRSLAPGDVLVVDPRYGNEVRASSEPDSQLVVGVYSTKPSVLAVGDRGVDDSLDGTVPVAMLGVVPTKVSAENGAVHAGDLLTSSGTPGYAMKATPIMVGGAAVYPTGAILGKALEPLHGDRGVIKVLVTLR